MILGKAVRKATLSTTEKRCEFSRSRRIPASCGAFFFSKFRFSAFQLYPTPLFSHLRSGHQLFQRPSPPRANSKQSNMIPLPPGGVRAAFSTSFGSWRKKNAIPLKHVAAELGVSMSTINAWERGVRFPTGYHIELIVKYTGLAPCRLFCIGSLQCSSPVHDDPLTNFHACS